jgi:hypothetical protein
MIILNHVGVIWAAGIRDLEHGACSIATAVI